MSITNLIAKGLKLSAVFEDTEMRLPLPVAIVASSADKVQEIVSKFDDPILVTTSDPVRSIKKLLVDPLTGHVLVHVKIGIQASEHERNILLRLQSAVQTGFIGSDKVINSPVFIFEGCLPEEIQGGFYTVWESLCAFNRLPELLPIDDRVISRITVMTEMWNTWGGKPFQRWLCATAFLLSKDDHDFQIWGQAITKIAAISKKNENPRLVVDAFRNRIIEWMKTHNDNVVDEKASKNLTMENRKKCIIKRATGWDIGSELFMQLVHSLSGFPSTYTKEILRSAGILVASDPSSYQQWIYDGTQKGSWTYRINRSFLHSEDFQTS